MSNTPNSATRERQRKIDRFAKTDVLSHHYFKSQHTSSIWIKYKQTNEPTNATKKQTSTLNAHASIQCKSTNERMLQQFIWIRGNSGVSQSACTAIQLSCRLWEEREAVGITCWHHTLHFLSEIAKLNVINYVCVCESACAMLFAARIELI